MTQISVFVDELLSLLDYHFGRANKYKPADKRWVCPACQVGAVRVKESGKDEGKITCFSCNGTSKELLQAANAWADYLKIFLPTIGKTYDKDSRENGNNRSTRQRRMERQAKVETYKDIVRLSPHIPEKFVPLKYFSPLPLPTEETFFWRKHGVESRKTIYQYSDTQRILRYDPLEKVSQTTQEDLSKTFVYQMLVESPEGSTWEKGKPGELSFPAYHLLDAIAAYETYPEDQKPTYVVMVEGEKCADWFSQVFKVATISPDGAGWNAERLTALAKNLQKLKLGVLFLPDFDKAGRQKALRWEEVARTEGVFNHTIHLNTKFPFIQEGQDIADVIALMFKKQNAHSLKEFLKMADTNDELRDTLDGFYEKVFNSEMNETLTSEEEVELKKTELDQTYSRNADRESGRHPEVIPSQADLAREILEDEGHCIRWIVDKPKHWAFYYPEEGIWKEASDEDVQAVVRNHASAAGLNRVSFNFIESVTRFMKVDLRHPAFDQPRHLIPFKNGVLDKSTNKFSKHSPQNNLLWTLPYDYDPTVVNKSRLDLAHECFPILNWLLEAMGNTREDLQLVNLLCSYLAATIRGKTHFQKYLECIGPAGSGKGTFLRLASALIGLNNTASTTLGLMESSRFEAAKLTEAALILVTDAESHIGDCKFLNALVGEDIMPSERKFAQEKPGDGKAAQGMMILAGERIPSSSDSGGVRRRRITVQFRNPPKSSFHRRNLIKVTPDGVQGEFAPYMGAFFQYLLTFSDQEIENYILHTDFYVPRLAKIRAESILETNNLAQWANESLYWDGTLNESTGLPYLMTSLGKVERDRDGITNAGMSLYANYVKWANSTGIRNVLSIQGFKKSLEELFNQLEMPISIRRPSGRGNHVYGLGIRDELSCGVPYIIEELYSRKLQNKNRSLVAPRNLERGNGFSQERVLPQAQLNDFFLFQGDESTYADSNQFAMAETPGGVGGAANVHFFENSSKDQVLDSETFLESDTPPEKSFSKNPENPSSPTQPGVLAIEESNSNPTQLNSHQNNSHSTHSHKPTHSFSQVLPNPGSGETEQSTQPTLNTIAFEPDDSVELMNKSFTQAEQEPQMDSTSPIQPDDYVQLNSAHDWIGGFVVEQVNPEKQSALISALTVNAQTYCEVWKGGMNTFETPLSQIRKYPKA